jgi:hypothetical protein
MLAVYKTINTIKHLLKSRGDKGDMYSQSSIYQVQCNECPLKYIGQLGHAFKLPETIRAYDTIDQTRKAPNIARRRCKLNASERYHIYKLSIKKPTMNDIFTYLNNPIFDILTKTYSQ